MKALIAAALIVASPGLASAEIVWMDPPSKSWVLWTKEELDTSRAALFPSKHSGPNVRLEMLTKAGCMGAAKAEATARFKTEYKNVTGFRGALNNPTGPTQVGDGYRFALNLDFNGAVRARYFFSAECWPTGTTPK